MNRRDLILIICAGAIGAIVAVMATHIVFDPVNKRSKIPVVDKVESSFPDINSEQPYKSFLNPKSLDPTQPIQIGNSQNASPFNPQ